MPGHEPIYPLPDAHLATFNTADQLYLSAEGPAIQARYSPTTGFVVSGGLHGTAAGMVGDPLALEAFTELGNRITADGAGGTVAINYAAMSATANDTAWVIATAATPDISGNFHRVGSSNLMVNVLDSARPVLPANSVWLMKVSIAASAITAVQDLRVPSSYARHRAYDPTDPLYGAVGDGVTDSTAALQAAVNAAGVCGDIVRIPAGVFQLTATLTVPWPNVTIQGTATDAMFQSVAATRGTVLRWAGVALGTMVEFGPVTPVAPYMVWGCLFEHCTMLGMDTAAHNLVVSSAMNSEFRNLVLTGATNAALLVRDIIAPEVAFSITNHCEFKNLMIGILGSGAGILIDGATFLHFANCSVVHDDGAAYHVVAADDCFFFNCSASRAGGGVGYSIFLNGTNDGSGKSSLASVFLGFNGQGPVRAQGDVGWTHPALANFLLSTAIDGAMTIEIGGGATLYHLDLGGYQVGTDASMLLPGMVGLEATALPTGPPTRILLVSGAPDGNPFIGVAGGTVTTLPQFSKPPQLPTYLVGTLPALGAGNVGALAYCSNLSGAAGVVYWDTTQWRRVVDGTVAS